MNNYVETHPEAKIRLIMPAGTFPPMEMRAQSIRRALDNLISNAMRYAHSAEIRLKIIPKMNWCYSLMMMVQAFLRQIIKRR